MKLCDRDIEILRYIRDAKTMNIDQIKRRFWPSQTMRTARKKMASLAVRGNVLLVKKDFLKVSSYYYLTKQGYAMLAHAGKVLDVETPFLPEPSAIVRADFQHHVRVTDLRIALEMDKQIRVSRWVSETEIRADKSKYPISREVTSSKKRKIPDGLFILEDSESRIDILLEYEHLRYQRGKFSGYMEEWEFNWPKYQKLIVTADAERAEDLRLWCLEDLKRIHKIDLNRGVVKLQDLAEAYLFTSYDSIMQKGFLKADLKTPLEVIQFTPIETKI